jgi:hypothetical protein
MELPKYEKTDSIELYKYTKEQLFIKDKIRLGMTLDNDDYRELYYDLLDKFKELSEDNKLIKKNYNDYLNKKYNTNFKFSIIKKVILDQLIKEKGYLNEC